MKLHWAGGPVSIVWMTVCGHVNPSRYEANRRGWLSLLPSTVW